jgi:imidazole glycerol-phosphate synthase subunit HisH
MYLRVIFLRTIMVIGLLDYGLSNIRNVQKAFEHLGVATRLIDEPAGMAGVDKLVLPGVGAFAAGMAGLRDRGLTEPIRAAVQAGIPFLGICLGMQLLFESSAESPGVAGLGLLPGVVKRFDDTAVRVPHMGWNQLTINQASPLLRGVPDGAYAYFVHSYYCEPTDPALMLALADYHQPFAAIAGRDQFYGIQFHPEKSQAVGLQILRNFAFG